MLPEQDILRKLFRLFGVDCVFDVGANHGQYATMLRKHVGFRGDIISFEPVPACATDLRRQSAADHRWHIEECALADVDSECELNVMRDTQFSSLLEPEAKYCDLTHAGNAVEQVIPIRQRTLATFVDDYRKRLGFSRPFLKMDTQGNDLRVAAGAGPTLADFVGLQSELSVIPIYAGMPSFTEALKYYEDSGFVITAFVPNNAGHFPYLIEFDCIMSNERRLDCI